MLKRNYMYEELRDIPAAHALEMLGGDFSSAVFKALGFYSVQFAGHGPSGVMCILEEVHGGRSGMHSAMGKTPAHALCCALVVAGHAFPYIVKDTPDA